ncbi:hypothetical protein PAMP_023124 [Pampus punctatissimus]
MAGQKERDKDAGDLNRNNITRITKVDFSGIKNLRILHLEDNQISVVERGAFQDLRLLERLRLNRNKLQFLPELLFQSNPKLGRLPIGVSTLSPCLLHSFLPIVIPGESLSGWVEGSRPFVCFSRHWVLATNK